MGGGGGGDEAKQDQPGKARSPNKTTTPPDRQGGIPWGGGARGRGGVAALHHIYIYIYACVYNRRLAS